jgi:hypothetical protein
MWRDGPAPNRFQRYGKKTQAGYAGDELKSVE